MDVHSQYHDEYGHALKHAADPHTIDQFVHALTSTTHDRDHLARPEDHTLAAFTDWLDEHDHPFADVLRKASRMEVHDGPILTVHDRYPLRPGTVAYEKIDVDPDRKPEHPVWTNYFLGSGGRTLHVSTELPRADTEHLLKRLRDSGAEDHTVDWGTI